jgi:hypothetical protein
MDFSISIAPADFTVSNGGVSYQMMTSPLSGFSSTLNLSYAITTIAGSSQPTVGLNPTLVPGSGATLNVFTPIVNGAWQTGQWEITVFASDHLPPNQLQRTAKVRFAYVPANSADFQIWITPPAAPIPAGQSAVYAVYVNPVNGLDPGTQVTLSFSNMPAGAASIPSTFTVAADGALHNFSVSTTTATPSGQFYVTGSGGGHSHSVWATLTTQSTPSGTYTISGTILQPNNLGMGGTTLSARDGQNALVATVSSDDNGNYSFVGLQPGQYTVTASSPFGAFNPVSETYNLTSPGIVKNRRVMTLLAAPDPDPDPSGPFRYPFYLKIGETKQYPWRFVNPAMNAQNIVGDYCRIDPNSNVTARVIKPSQPSPNFTIEFAVDANATPDSTRDMYCSYKDGNVTRESASIDYLVLQPGIVITPPDVSVSPGEIVSLTASGSSAYGAYNWSIGAAQTGDNTAAFQFVSSSCNSGSSCPAVAPSSCPGAQSCTVNVQAVGTGFAYAQVSPQSGGPTLAGSARIRAITAQITKIWSDQFPTGPVANYLPADGTPESGAGAGLVGNARQLLILGPRQSVPSDPVSGLGIYGFIKANVTTTPSTQEALDHVLVRVVQGIPNAPVPPSTKATAPSLFSPEGLGGANGSVFSIVIPQQPNARDYTVVAGVDRGQNQITDQLTSQQISDVFYLPCAVPAFRGQPCSNGAVRVASHDENSGTWIPYYALGGAVSLFEEPTAAQFLINFATGLGIVDPKPTAPSRNSGTMDISTMLFNNGLVLANPTGGAPNLYAGTISQYSYPLGNHVATEKIWAAPAFLELIEETIQLHKPEIVSYFSSHATESIARLPALGTGSSSSGVWQVIGCDAAARAAIAAGVTLPSPCLGRDGDSTSTAFDYSPSGQVDIPRVYPCLKWPTWFTNPSSLLTTGDLPLGLIPSNFAGLECDLTFKPTTALPNDDLFLAFGRVGHNITMQANITKQADGTFKVNSVSLSGYIFDTYQWNANIASDDYHLSNIQAESNGQTNPLQVAPVGQVFQTIVPIDTVDTAGGQQPLQLNYPIR